MDLQRYSMDGWEERRPLGGTAGGRERGAKKGEGK